MFATIKNLICYDKINLIPRTVNQNLGFLSNNLSTLTKVDIKNGVKKITMCDHNTRNSLSIAMMENLINNINNKNTTDLRVILINAEGNIFSAGHNLKELTSDSGQNQHEKVFRLASKLMLSIVESPVPVIAQVNGLAAAAGCQLVAQCDIAICTETSKFSTPGANFGIFCSTPGIALARKVQKSTALHMLLTGLPIDSQEAKISGLVSKVCSLEKLEEETEKICESIKAKSKSIVTLGKKFYYRQIEMDLESAYEAGAAKMVENLNTKDGKEGVNSFFEKRKPVWSHEQN